MSVNVIINFPAICIARDKTISLVNDDMKIEICSITAFKNGYLNKQLIYDSSGKKYEVSKSTLVQRMPLYWGWKKILSMPLMVRAKLEIEERGNYSIDELRTKIIKLYKSGSWLKGLLKEEAKEFIGNLEEAYDFDTLYSVLKNWGA